jgi:hypothetical protein
VNSADIEVLLHVLSSLSDLGHPVFANMMDRIKSISYARSSENVPPSMAELGQLGWPLVRDGLCFLEKQCLLLTESQEEVPSTPSLRSPPRIDPLSTAASSLTPLAAQFQATRRNSSNTRRQIPVAIGRTP